MSKKTVKLSDIIKDEFDEFDIIGKNVVIPSGISSKVMRDIETRLSPNLYTILGKVFLIQVIISFLTLFLCPQFDIGFYLRPGLFDWMNEYSRTLCTSTCAAFFIGIGAFTTSFLISFDEKRVIGMKYLIYYFILGFITILLFQSIGGYSTLYNTFVWLISFIGTGILASKVGYELRESFMETVC